MTAPVRTPFHVAVEFKKEPEKMTLREATEWFKAVIRQTEEFSPPTIMETKLVNERWAILVSAVAKQQGVPAGMLSYFLSELAATEMRLAETAEAEYQAAVSYPAVPDVEK